MDYYVVTPIKRMASGETDGARGLRRSIPRSLVFCSARQRQRPLGTKYKMNDGLQDVISAAIGASERKAAPEAPGRWAPQLRAVDTKRDGIRNLEPLALAPAPEPAPTPAVASAPAPAPASAPAPATEAFGETDQIGRGGLRLAFWLCGFHDAFSERRRRGEQLTEHEESLLALTRNEFIDIRSVVIKMALERLNAVANAPALLAEVEAGASRGKPLGTMEGFALETLRSLSRRALQLLQESGPDAAFSLFSEDAYMQEPLAIFQQVFTTAATLVESFERLNTSESKLLSRLAATLGSEVEGI